MRSKILGAQLQKHFRAKTCKIWPDFRRLRSLVVNISERDEDIQNRTSIWSTAIPLALGEKRCVNFCPVTLEISMWNCTHLKRLFLKTIFWLLGSAAPPYRRRSPRRNYGQISARFVEEFWGRAFYLWVHNWQLGESTVMDQPRKPIRLMVLCWPHVWRCLIYTSFWLYTTPCPQKN